MSKTHSQSFMSSTKKDFSKRCSNTKQFPSFKHASSSTEFWKPTLSTAYLTMSGYSSGRKIGLLCGTMGRINTKQMGLLYRMRRFQDSIQFNVPSFNSSNKSESIFLPVIMRRGNGTSPEMGSRKGLRSGSSWFLLLTISCPEKERKVTSYSSVGCAVRLETRRSRVQPPPRSASFFRGDYEIFSMVILSLLLIQEGQLSVSGERMCTILVNHLED